jgi:16S rRNA (cytidine1402-2'-O)-methyltransferase
MSGTLFVCGTPIGNLGDISRRLEEVLGQVDLVAAEDTRRSSQLLNHLGIRKPLVSYHEHNLRKSGQALLEKLKSGLSVALVSDAGMPGISDPGEVLIQSCIQEGIRVELVAGPVAGIHALILSGLPTERFAFEGFPDRNKKTRRAQFEALAKDERTLIFYEAPHRLESTLKDLLECFGDRQIAVARELTKRYEEFVRGTISEAIRHFEVESPKGEFVIVLAGLDPVEAAAANAALALAETPDEETILLEIRNRVNEGMSRKDAAAEIAGLYKLSKKEVYRLSTLV